MCAAIEAAQAGSSVLVLDKNDFPGGDTVRSGGMVMAAGTDVAMVTEMCEKSPDQIAFMQSLGRSYTYVDGRTMAMIAAYDGDGSRWKPRTHWDPNARTGHYVYIYNRAVELGVRFVNATEVAHLVQNASGEVVGVTDTAGNASRANKGVVISTASFGNNLEMSK